ncbi:hypothetical protein Tco_1260707, partial [Tanacetum coccineum]
TMADMNIPTNDAPAEQPPTVAPLTRMDDQILSLSMWVPIGKSNCVLDVHKPQRNPIFPIVVALLKNTNFFKAFTASSMIPAIYIQQFWDTVCFNSSTGLYNCQLDQQWFNLYKYILRDALDITPTNDNNPFVAPPSIDTVIEYVNTLGYPSTLKNVSAMSVNALYQPWRAILTMINMCLTGKTTRYDRPRHPVLQILWGIIHRSNIDYAERIWEEFIQSIQTFLTDRKNLATAACGKKKTAHMVIPSVRFTKLIIHHLRTKHNIHPRTGSPFHYSHEEIILNTLRFVGKDGREIFGMPIPNALLTDEIKGAPYYGDYQEQVVKYQQFLDAEHGKAKEGATIKSFDATKVTKPKAAKVTKPTGDKTPKPTATQPPKPTPTPTQPSKAVSEKKRKLVKETPNEPSPAKISKGRLVGKRRKPKSPLKLVDEPSDEEQAERTQGPAYPVVLRELDSGKYQPKVVDEQAAYDLLTLQTLTKKSPVDQFIFQRRPPMHTEPTGQADSPSLDAELPLTDSETESDEEVPVINAGDQDEGQEILKLLTEDQVILEEPASSTRTLSSLQNLDKDLSFTNQFFVEKPHEEEPGKTNAEAEVQSMVLVPIHQDTSLVPPMPTPVIDLMKSQYDSPLPTSTATTSIIIKTTTLPPPPLQSTTDPILVHRIGEFEQHIADLIQNNLALEESFAQVSGARYSNQHLADQDEARKKNSNIRESPRTPPGSPPTQLPPSPPLTGASSAPTDIPRAQELSPTDYLMHDDSIPKEQVHLSDDEDSKNDHQLKANSRKDWWKPLPEEERPETPEPAWTIPSSNKSDVVNKIVLMQANFKGQAYEVVKAFYPDVIHLNFQMEKCHKMLTAQGSNPALSISKMKAASYLDFGLELLVSEQMWIDDVCTYDISAKYGISYWWFNRQKFYIDWHDSLSRRKDVRTHMRILNVIRIKAYSRYGDFEDLNLLLLQGYLDHLPGSDKRMLSTAIKQWTQNLVIRRRVEDFQLGIESYQTQLNLTKPGWDATGYGFKHDYTIIESPRAVVFPVDNNDRKIIRFNEIYKFSDGTLTRILEVLDYRVKEFKVKRLNPSMNRRFWTEKDVTRSKEFIAAIERRLK